MINTASTDVDGRRRAWCEWAFRDADMLLLLSILLSFFFLFHFSMHRNLRSLLLSGNKRDRFETLIRRMILIRGLLRSIIWPKVNKSSAIAEMAAQCCTCRIVAIKWGHYCEYSHYQNHEFFLTLLLLVVCRFQLCVTYQRLMQVTSVKNSLVVSTWCSQLITANCDESVMRTDAVRHWQHYLIYSHAASACSSSSKVQN